MRVILAQLDFTVGDLPGNAQQIITTMLNGTYDSQGAIVVFPELSITGYPPLDLVDNSSFITAQLQTLDEILKRTSSVECLFVLGYIERNEGPGKGLYNSAAVCHRGKVIYNYRKRLLPTYDVFDEARYFEPGKDMGLFTFFGYRIGVLICEDIWHNNKLYTLNPIKELYNAQADMVLSLNASPSIAGKHEYRKEMVISLCRQYYMPIFYVNTVGGNDDIVFDGNSFAVDALGGICGHAKRFEPDILSIQYMGKHLCSLDQPYIEGTYKSSAEFFYEQAVYGIREYVKKCGFKGAVIGESGGIDSAVVTALAVAALGKDNVVGITMPSQYSSTGSYEDSQVLCDRLGVRLYTFPIKSSFDLIIDQFNDVFETAPAGVTEQNLQARIRGQVLMAFSNRHGHLVLSTGNKSELSVGYCTLYGDMAGGMAPISDLYKMEVYAVAKYINELAGTAVIPQAILDKEPSAELAPGQKDTDNLPPYPILDAILKLNIEGELLGEKEKFACQEIVRFNQDYAEKTLRLMTGAEFKRRQAAIGIKMHQKAFGYGRRVPIAQKWRYAFNA